MARTTQKANKSPVSKLATSPKPKVVPTSNGKKVKAPVTVQRDERSFKQLTQEERAELLKDLAKAIESCDELVRRLEEEEEEDEVTYEEVADFAKVMKTHDKFVRRFHELGYDPDGDKKPQDHPN